jgi:ribonuclease HI
MVGLSLPSTPAAKVMMYADDTNLFASANESIPDILQVLDHSSLAIGSLFNQSKTLVKPVGSLAFREACHISQQLAGHSFASATVLGPTEPVRILGIWVGHPDRADGIWRSVIHQVKFIISQWKRIGASFRNRALLAKALMQSCCYYLLDGNGIPPLTLRRLSSLIQAFVKGPCSRAPGASLEHPLSDSGINCPSLSSRKLAYDIRFLGQLADPSTNLPWQIWTRADLIRASTPGTNNWSRTLDPFLQQCWTHIASLEPRLKAAWITAKRLHIDLSHIFPTRPATLSSPTLYHPAIPDAVWKACQRCQFCCIPPLTGDFVDLSADDLSMIECKPCSMQIHSFLDSLSPTAWSPSPRLPPAPGLVAASFPTSPHPESFLTFLSPRSILFRKYTKGQNALAHSVLPPPPAPPLPRRRAPLSHMMVDVWTDGSTLNNGLSSCSAGAAWTTPYEIEASFRLVGPFLSNNMAEVAAVISALVFWRYQDLVIHTDSSYVLSLVNGGLSSLERVGWWRAGIPTNLLQFLLYSIRSHGAPLVFTKASAHSSDQFNNRADSLANSGRISGPVLRTSQWVTPPGWVSSAPFLVGCPLAASSSLIACTSSPVPLYRERTLTFLLDWYSSLRDRFDVRIEKSRFFTRLWTINIPPTLRDIIWCLAHDTIPLGNHFRGPDLGKTCRCGSEMSLPHMWLSCPAYDLQPLSAATNAYISRARPGTFVNHDSIENRADFWYPLLALQEIETELYSGKRRKILCSSRSTQEWAFGCYLWHIWRSRWAEIYQPGFVFDTNSTSALTDLFEDSPVCAKR